MPKRFLTTALATGLILTASMAQAFEVTGGDLAFLYSSELGSNDEQYSLRGSVDTAITERLGLQFDGAVWTFAGPGIPTLWAVGVHGYYSVDPNWDVGLFVTHENWVGLELTGFGAEVAFQNGPWAVEAAVGRLEGLGLINFAVIDAEYAFNGSANGFSLIGGAGYFDEGFAQISQISIGGRYAFENGAYVEATYTYEDQPFSTNNEYVALNLGFEFGAGSTFNSRLTPVLLGGN